MSAASKDDDDDDDNFNCLWDVDVWGVGCVVGEWVVGEGGRGKRT